MVNTTKADYRRARRELERQTARLIDEALSDAFTKASRCADVFIPQIQIGTFERLFVDYLDAYVRTSRFSQERPVRRRT